MLHVLALAAQAPGRTIDEGTFVITQNGTQVGRESFRIVRAPSASGDVYRATAQLALGAQRIEPTLSVDSSGTPLSYDVRVRDGTEPAVLLQARARPGRLSAMVRTRNGESTKEYLVPSGVVVLDDEIAHQLFFVTLGGRQSGSLTVIDPRTTAQSMATLENRGAATLDIAGKPMSATHFVLSAAGFRRREFWLDSAGRVLRVSIPERAIVATRDEIPR
jgi:hypothetical protein